MATQIFLPNQWTPHRHQLEAMHAADVGINRHFLVWHRRAGKDSFAVNHTARKAHPALPAFKPGILQARPGIGTYLHMLPTARQARKVVWMGIDKQGRRIIDQAFPVELRKRTLDDEMLIEFKNGSIWQAVGSDGFDNLVGTNPLGITFSEWSLSDPRAWDFMRPILAENLGWAIFIGTPRGRNFFYDQWKLVENNPRWFASLRTVAHTGLVSPEIIEAERAAGMPESRIQQEFYCSFDATNIGSIYLSYIEAIQKRGQIGSVPYDRRYPVETSWDLGHRDATAIVFYQRVGKAIHVIDYIEERGKDLAYFANKVRERGYSYSRHVTPHDTNKFEWGAGTTILEAFRNHGLHVTVAPKLRIEDGIEATRATLPRMYFDTARTASLIRALKNYRYEEDEEKSTVKSSPLHDWSSHACDAVRYLAVTPEGQGVIPAWAREVQQFGVPDWMAAQQSRWQPDMGRNGGSHIGGPSLDRFAQYDPLAAYGGR